jgi:hypothetical protein
MSVRYTDNEIARLLTEQKQLPSNYQNRVQLKRKRGHRESELDVLGVAGSQFRLIMRLNSLNQLDFSIILATLPPGSNSPFRLCRYNGKSHEHTNHIEGHKFYDFHIHTATARYQHLGAREDGYAQPSNRFSDYSTAISCLVTDCAFIVPPGSQASLFGELLR